MSIEEKLKIESYKEYHNDKIQKVKLSEYDSKNDLVCDLKKYSHAFVLACIMDRQITAERAWGIPYEIKNIIGSFDMKTLENISLEEYKKIFSEHSLHRFNENMATAFYKAIKRINECYGGDASNMWNDKPSSAILVSRFLDFDGVGIKIATMATNILSRVFKVELSDYYSVDISPDVHVKRVFKRMGLVKDSNNVDKIIYRAKSISPEFPGILDLTCWKLGKDVCRPKNPKCEICMFKDECPKIINEDDK